MYYNLYYTARGEIMKIKIQDYTKQLSQKIIAVDFDDTITEYRPYPEPAPLRKEARKYLEKLHKKGYRIVLWTARVNELYDEAYNKCIKDFEMPFIEKDSLTKGLIHGSSGKLVASFYIDDKSVPGKLNWRKIYKYIIKHIV